MRKIFFVARFLVAVFFIAGAPTVSAQLFTAPPQIRDSVGPVQRQKIHFILDWPSVTPPTGFDQVQFVNPPRPITTNSVSRWQYFWVWDDGYYSLEEKPQREFSTAGRHTAYVAIKPTYSTDDEPNMRVADITVSTPGTSPVTVFPPTTFFSTAAPPAPDVHLAQQYSTTRPGDSVVYVIAVRNRDQAKTRSGVLRLAFDADQTFINFSELRSEFTFSRVKTVPGDATHNTKRVYEWDITSLPPGSEKRFAFNLEVFPFTPTQLGMEGRTITLNAGIQWADGQGGVNDNGFSVTNPYHFPDEVTQHLSVKTSIDPNFIVVEPTVVPPGYQGSLRYDVHFANKGSANADSVRVLIFQDNSLDPASANVAHELKFDASFITVTETADSITWATSFNLPHDTVPPGTNLGKVFLRINPKPAPPASLYVHGDTIRTYAIIDMDGSLDTTNIAKTAVREFKGVCLPAFWGIKAYFEYGLGGDTLLHKGGFRAALTWRKNLTRFKNYSIGQSSILIDKPTWWWQIELGGGYSRLQPAEGIKLNVYRVDLTPVMIRWVSKPGGPSPSHPFFYGFSGGYTLSGIVGTSGSGGSYSVSNSFGDRLEHTLSASLDLGNILGEPGWSFGLGYAQRFTRITGQSESYGLGFIYVHYNFKNRPF